MDERAPRLSTPRTVALLLSAAFVALAPGAGPALGDEADAAALEMARWCATQGDWSAALDETDALLAAGKDSAQLRVLRGTAEFHLGAYEASVADLEIAHGNDPEDAGLASIYGMALVERAEELAAEGRQASAEVSFEKAAELLTYATARVETTEILLRAWARALAASGRAGEEPAALRAILAQAPGAADVRARLASLLRDRGDHAAARALLEAAPGPTETLDRLLFNVAVFYYQEESFSDVVEVCTHLIQRDAPHVPSLRLRGLAYYRQGRGEEARADLTRFVELAPDAPEADAIRQELSKTEVN